MKSVLDFIKPLRSVFDINSEGILITNLQGKIAYCNPILSKFLKQEVSTLKGRMLASVFPELNFIEIDNKISRRHSFKSTISIMTENRISIPEIPVSAFHLGDNNDPVGVQFIFESFGKLTDQDKFSSKNQSILKVMDNRPDIGWIVSDIQTGKNHFASSGLEKITGWTKEDFLNVGWAFGLANIHKEDLGSIMEVYQRNIEKRIKQPFVHDHLNWETHFRYKRKNKGYVKIKCITGVLERDANQQIKFLIVSFTPRTKNTATHKVLTEEEHQHDSIRIIDGKPYINLEFLQNLRKNKLNHDLKEDLPDISERELEVLLLMSEGLSSDKIASRLHVSSHTIKTHRKALMKKLDAKNAAELIRKAEKMGFF